MSDKLDDKMTRTFLEDVMNSDETSEFSLLSKGAARYCLEYYWSRYKYWTISFLQLPYVIQMVFLGLITIYGDFKAHTQAVD